MRANFDSGNNVGQSRRGSYALELLLVLPIVMAILFAFVYFSMVVSAQQRLMAASSEGARVASRGGSREAVEEAVENVLGDGRLGSATVTVRFENERGQQLLSGDPIEVIVKIEAKEVFPNILAFVAVDGDNTTLVGRAVRRLE